MASKEIVTLQIGHYANFVGTHWWNLQEATFSYDPKHPSEVDHDILFREGCIPQGVTTYLPRLIAIDLKGSLKSLKKDGVLYNAASKGEPHLWLEPLEIQKTEPLPKNEYLTLLENEEKLRNEIPMDSGDDKDICQASSSEAVPNDVPGKRYDLDSTVETWTDYLCMHLHPQSVHLIKEYSHKNDIEPFHVFQYGQKVMSVENQMEDVEDRIHYFVEECDKLQGFHVLLDAKDAFGGVATSVTSYLNDEFGNKGIITIPVFDVSSGEQKLNSNHLSLLNSCLCLEKIANLSSLTVPLSCFSSPWHSLATCAEFPFLKLNPSLSYHTAAVLASGYDTASLLYRSKGSCSDVRDFANTFSVYGRKFAALSTVLPFPIYKDVSIADSILKLSPDLTPQSLTPNCALARSRSIVQQFVLRGLPTKMKLNVKDVVRHLETLKQMATFDDLLHWFASEMCPSSFSSFTKLAEPLKVSDPFPHIFDEQVSAFGIVCPEKRPSGTGVGSVPMLGGIHSSNNFKSMLNDLITSVSALNLRKLHSFIDAGLEQDEFVEMVENLRELMSCYDNNT